MELDFNIEKFDEGLEELNESEKQLSRKEVKLRDTIEKLKNDAVLYEKLKETNEEIEQEKEDLSRKKAELISNVKKNYLLYLEREKEYLEKREQIEEISEMGIDVDEIIKKLDKEKEDLDYSASELKQMFDKLEDYDPEIMKSIIDQNVSKLRLPQKNGKWEGDKGKSRWTLDEEIVIVNPKTGEEKHISSIEYKNNEPDFSEVEDGLIGHVELLSFPSSRNSGMGTYEMAYIEAAKSLSEKTNEIWTPYRVKKYMEKNGLTWHECADMKTVRAIPTEINDAFPHTGGISVKKGVDAIETGFKNRFGEDYSFSLQKDGINGEIKNLNEALNANKKVNREMKRH